MEQNHICLITFNTITRHTSRAARTLTGGSRWSVSMCRRQRGGSVVLWRQTPLNSKPSSSCFCPGFSRFHHLPLCLLELQLFLHHLFVSALHEARHGPLTAAPCRQESNKPCSSCQTEKTKKTKPPVFHRHVSVVSSFLHGARLSVALASSSSIRALIMGVSVQPLSLRWLCSCCLG